MSTPYIEDVLAELDDNAFDPATDIKEMFELSGTQPGGGDSFSLENAEAVLVYLIDWKKARAFIRWVLGFAYADKGAPYAMHRENPQIHPRFPWLTASTVSLSSIAPKANDQGTGAPKENSPNYPAVFNLDPNAITKTAYYDSCFCTVRFVQRNWIFRPDTFVTSPANELERNCVITPTPIVELLNAEGGTSQLLWQEGDAASANADHPKIDEVLTNIFSTRVAKVRLLVQMMWWPESYLSNDPLTFNPEKLFSCISMVNSKPFLGRPAGTLLCDAPKMERFQFPICTFDGLFPFYGWNITLPLTYFNPKLGVPEVGDPLANDAKARGHRCLPWRGNSLWFGVYRENHSTRYLDEEDFNVMLEHINA
jgi:hypothetical protein